MRLGLALALLMVLPAGVGGQLLVGVVPDLPGSAVGGEGFAVGAGQAIDLSGYQVTDGEGTYTFPDSQLDAGATVWVVGNLTNWRAHQGPEPAIQLPKGTGLVLSNDGDDLRLLAPDGTVLDAMEYGDRDTTGILDAGGTGLMFLREATEGPDAPTQATPNPWRDTDHASDWSTPREHRIGESTLDQPTFSVAALTLYASPDSTFSTLQGLIQSATRRLHLHVYELRSPDLVDCLVAAKQASPGLDLQVLVDSNPVGQSADERHATADALRRIQQVGGQATLAGNGRYDDHHLKVLVADDAVAVQSENWVPSGVPVDPTWGNRGWGAVLHDAPAADWFAQWMATDRGAWDATSFDLAAYDPLFEQPPRRLPRSGDYGPVVPALRLQGPIAARPLVSPDHTQDPRTDPVAALVDAAGDRVVVQQLDLARTARNRIGWSTPDPLLASLSGAAQRGVDVRVQAAAPFAADDTGNAVALQDLAAAGAQTSVLDRPGLATLHNKALVVDGRFLVLGSMNGNHHSRSANREVTLILDSPAAASWAEGLAASDWDPPGPPRDWRVPGQDLRAVPPAPWPTLLALLGVAAAARARR